MTDKLKNVYDRYDIIRLVGATHVGPLKFAAYRVRDPETQEFGTLQFHFTYNGTVLAVMGEDPAKMFCRLVENTIKNQEVRDD